MRYPVLACAVCSSSELEVEPTEAPPRLYVWCPRCRVYVVSVLLGVADASRLLNPSVGTEDSPRMLLWRTC